ncbi:HEAT repeat protein [mine drainage metagenome]|uniref:HEAT repeat protein n=1 Tax=mine drainage metagenome TaxID=410659 RepID=A0A1J5RE90_9ZZZZ
MLDFVTLSDPKVRLAFWIGAISVVLTVILTVEIILMRMALTAKKSRKRRLINLWEPILIRSIVDEEQCLPTLHSEDVVDVLLIWLRFQKIVRGKARSQLKHLLIKLSVKNDVINMMQGKKTDERLIAITVTGLLGFREVWGELVTTLNDPLPAVSVTAAQALLHIDDKLASLHVIPMIINRRDWAIDRVAMMFRDASQDFVEAFVLTVEKAELESQPYLLRLMRILDVLQLDRSLTFLRHILEKSDNSELVTATLKLVRSTNDIDLVRQRINDQNWSVQVQAAIVLGRLGTREDVPVLVSLMSSKDWWVRYRAAKSLTQLPFVSSMEIESIRHGLTDTFARDILSQVLAEEVIS